MIKSLKYFFLRKDNFLKNTLPLERTLLKRLGLYSICFELWKPGAAEPSKNRRLRNPGTSFIAMIFLAVYIDYILCNLSLPRNNFIIK